MMAAAEPPLCEAPDPDPGRPVLQAPAGTCDSHFHVFQPGYPLAPDRSFTPPPAPFAEYRRVMTALGIERAVFVQPSVYGTNNGLLMATLREVGPALRGVAVIDSNATERAIRDLHDAGVRGVRLNLLFGGGVPFSDAAALAERIKEYGWHLQLLLDASSFADLRANLAALPVPVVIDHMGHVKTDRGVDDPGFQDLLALLREGRDWVKLSGAYRMSAEDGPPYADTVPFAQALLDVAPDRAVWATDWPHPAHGKPMPKAAPLLDMVADWTSDPATQRRLLVENPARLYGFD
jgi:predicted TIM-barrel fold metal-dependent hydrolase